MTDKQKALYRDLWNIYEPFRFKVFYSDKDINELGKSVIDYIEKNVKGNSIDG